MANAVSKLILLVLYRGGLGMKKSSANRLGAPFRKFESQLQWHIYDLLVYSFRGGGGYMRCIAYSLTLNSYKIRDFGVMQSQ